MSDIRRTPHRTEHAAQWTEERRRAGVVETRLVTSTSWTVTQRTDCFCCSCGRDRDLHCRAHGFDGRRPCVSHGMAGQVDVDGTMPVEVHVRRAQLQQDGLL